jgi:hypothetical protein
MKAKADSGFVTTNETAAVDLAYEIFKTLEIDTAEELDACTRSSARGWPGNSECG